LICSLPGDTRKKRAHPFKGIFFSDKWRPRVYINGAQISTPGRFSTEGEAAAVYDSYAKAHGLEANSPERWQKWRKDHDGVDGFAMPTVFLHNEDTCKYCKACKKARSGADSV
jgi:hypothetical protein